MCHASESCVSYWKRKILLFALEDSSSVLKLSNVVVCSSVRNVVYFSHFLYRNINIKLKYLQAVFE